MYGWADIDGDDEPEEAGALAVRLAEGNSRAASVAARNFSMFSISAMFGPLLENAGLAPLPAEETPAVPAPPVPDPPVPPLLVALVPEGLFSCGIVINIVGG